VYRRIQIKPRIFGARFLLAICFALFVYCGAQISADAAPTGKSVYEKARQDYIRISEKDSEVKELMDWERAASGLYSFVRKYEDSDYAPRAMYLLGRLYEQTYRKREFKTGLSRALYFYKTLAKKYRGHALADDALLLLGDLRRDALVDEAAARAAYFEIVDVYPKGDMFSKAQERLGLAKEDSAPEKSEKRSSGGILSLLTGPRVGSDGKEIYSAEKRGVRRPMIVIDPGHGGSEEGAHGADGVLEKDIVLSISLMLDELLRERLRANTVLTRTTDVHIPLEERTRIANESNADIFVSIHANASEFKTARGIETYYLDNTNDKSSLKLAKRENASLGQSKVGDLEFIISDLIQNAKVDGSISLAHDLQDALYSTISRYYKGTKNLGVKKAPFYVLVGAHMPCALAEVSFIDHPKEGRRLATRRYQKLVAAALYEGIRAYFDRETK
jgi:N-acetylmuramoyl-L-alanine amidase